MTVFGTRPEFIRLSVICAELDRYCDQVLVSTGQNSHPLLSEIFSTELGWRTPDITLRADEASFAKQFGHMVGDLDRALETVAPDRVLLLGDTNTTLAASIAAARRGIPTFHLEAGNRCHDSRVPEEVNRRIIDHCTTIALPYTHRSKENLIHEGIERDRIVVVGNPIREVMLHYGPKIAASDVLQRQSLTPGNYFLVTAHRAENVDDGDRLGRLFEGLTMAARHYQIPVIVSTHPRTADNLRRWNVSTDEGLVRLCEPFGFFDFSTLERHARCVITDSGTVQEECCILGVPAVTIRDTTERPETVECGSNMLAGVEPTVLLQALSVMLDASSHWDPPPEYMEQHVSKTVSRVALGFMPWDAAGARGPSETRISGFHPARLPTDTR